MSGYAATKWAYEQRTGGGIKKAVLVYLAGRADQAYTCFPKVSLIAKETEVCERSVHAALAELVAGGFIRILYRYRSDGSQRSNRYLLLVEGPETPLPEGEDWSRERAQPAPHAPGGVQEMQATSMHLNNQGELPEVQKLPPAPPTAPPTPPPSTAVAKIETAQTITAGWIDYCRSRGVELTQRLIGRWARQIKEVLVTHPADLIKKAMALMLADNQQAYPNLLDQYVVQLQAGTRRWQPVDRPNPRALKNQRHADLIARLQAQEQTAPPRPSLLDQIGNVPGGPRLTPPRPAISGRPTPPGAVVAYPR